MKWSDLQTEFNGPLTPAVRRRFHEAKNRLNLTLDQVGKRMSFSGPFMSQLLRDKDPARMRSKHVDRVAAALTRLEKEAGMDVELVGVVAAVEATEEAQAASAEPPVEHSLENLIRLAHRLGFEVSFKPLGR